MWAAIIATTCVLLAALQKLLWLTVPFLLALILYYLLQPFMQALLYRGASRPMAAGVTMGGFLTAMFLAGGLALPQAATHLIDWQATLLRYLQGGQALLDLSLRTLEARWSLFAKAQLADTMAARLADFSNSLTAYLEPLVLGAASWAPALLLTPFLTFFFLRDGRIFLNFLARAVPNAFFERTLKLIAEVDRTARAYFQGLLWLTVLDTLTLGLGLWLLGFPGAWLLGLVCAVLAWLPYIGSILGGVLVVLVAATDFPQTPELAWQAVALFVLARLLDDFVYMPLTIGKSLRLHPLITVVMIFVGGAVAGVAGLMLVLPVLGVVMVIGLTLGQLLTDARLLARHRHARRLRRALAEADLPAQ
ncbi:MAG: AI-2E family transporter [Rhodocyclaceae bacterium]|nr:AI-2E family transporter [Rhodocyclaceae bacterium]